MSTPKTSSPYLLLFRGTDWDRSLSPAELQTTMSDFFAWFERLSAKGTVKGGHPLMEEARVLSGKNGRAVADGPFAESKEAIGGYLLIEAESLDHAVEIVRQSPILDYGTIVEIRPIAAECPTMQRARQVQTELMTAGV